MGECLSCGEQTKGNTCGKMTHWTIEPDSAKYGPCPDCFCDTCRTDPVHDPKWRRYFAKNKAHF